MSFKSHLGIITGMLVSLTVFYLGAVEDITYAKWRGEFMSLFRSYEDIEYYCEVHLSLDEKVIIDLTDLKEMYRPYAHPLFGEARRYIYYRITPKAIKARNTVGKGEPGFRVVRRSPVYGFKAAFNPSTTALSAVDPQNLEQVRSFMREYGLKSVILPYYKVGWAQLIRKMSEWGFVYRYGNAHFILFSLQEGGFPQSLTEPDGGC